LDLLLTLACAVAKRVRTETIIESRLEVTRNMTPFAICSG